MTSIANRRAVASLQNLSVALAAAAIFIVFVGIILTITIDQLLVAAVVGMSVGVAAAVAFLLSLRLIWRDDMGHQRAQDDRAAVP